MMHGIFICIISNTLDDMPQKALGSLTHAQKERFAFIDLTTYSELAPNNLQLFHQTKNHHRTNTFKPIFEHNPEVILTGLCLGFGDVLSNGINQVTIVLMQRAWFTPKVKSMPLLCAQSITNKPYCVTIFHYLQG
jgi:hypothetical protein|tara:strand:- start:1247 stop:1651 length:405 start_codon:yes stop_codon:yes gene_type:complete